MEDTGPPDPGEKFAGLVRPYAIITNTDVPSQDSATGGWFSPPGQIIARIPDELPVRVVSSDQLPTTRRPVYRGPITLAAAGFATLACLAFLTSPHESSPTAVAGKCRLSGCYQVIQSAPVVFFPVTLTRKPGPKPPTMQSDMQVDNVKQAATANIPAETATHSPSPSAAPTTGSCGQAPFAPGSNRAPCGGPGRHRHRRH
jgi:hypothetical protein